MEYSLDRFHRAQADSYETALREIRAGRKESHWIWYIFPQLRGLGQSAVAEYYELQDREEALAYWNDPVLSARLVEITRALLNQEGRISWIMGYPDHLKLRSCMTLFYLVTGESLFRDVLQKFFGGEMCSYTAGQLKNSADSPLNP